MLMLAFTFNNEFETQYSQVSWIRAKEALDILQDEFEGSVKVKTSKLHHLQENLNL